ncbi:MAG: CCA tRNA nucleotidyltransferase [Bacillota bacterium]|nr:CCA tRNA nucleotidyltransferase [Bacillota bacterium]
MEIKLPDEVRYIIEILNKNGYEAYIVGGCVRDCLLNKEPKDWDITTNALPEIIIKLFKKTIPTGLKHGTVTVLLNNNQFEVTTYRIDGEYLDNRHPSEVTFTDSLTEDLSRRDFTINAMAYNDTIGLVDKFNGKEDLKNKIISAVGNADARFNEDALRELRAVRFSSQLDFEISRNTFDSIIKNSELIKKISAERIKDELCKILMTDNPSKGIRALNEAKLLNYILPELTLCIDFNQHNPHHDKDVFEHILSVLDNTPKDLTLRLAALFHDIGKPKCFSLDNKGIGHFYGHNYISAELSEEILKRLKFDNDTIKKVYILTKEHMSHFDKVTSLSVKTFINRTGKENLDLLFELIYADIKGHKPPYDFEKVDKLKEKTYKILEEKLPLCIKDLDVTGYDLMEIGYKKGKELGNILNKLLNVVLNNPSLNTKKDLLKIAEKDLKSSQV